MDDVLRDYATSASDLAPRFEALRARDVLAPVLDHLPPPPATIADIGAGTGRDAAWLAARGYRMTAVEPVSELVSYGREAHGEVMSWVSDTLPDLDTLRGAARRFDCVLAVSVWHHLSLSESAAALRSLQEIVAQAGRVILSIKVFAGDRETLTLDQVQKQAQDSGWRSVATQRASSLQDHNRLAGNMWDWLVLARASGEDRR
ncbi:MAG: class I SAM-dependent methyltransferase [Arenibacterium sp.]